MGIPEPKSLELEGSENLGASYKYRQNVGAKTILLHPGSHLPLKSKEELISCILPTNIPRLGAELYMLSRLKRSDQILGTFMIGEVSVLPDFVILPPKLLVKPREVTICCF